MKPHGNKPNKRAAKGAVRRQIHAHLGWLQGFPMGPAKDQGLPWHVVPMPGREPAHDLIIDRDRIRRTGMALKAIVHRFPRALPRLVGDVVTWQKAFGDRLELLKGAINSGDPLPGLAGLLEYAGYGSQLNRRMRVLVQGSLADVVHSLAWIYWGDKAGLVKALEWLDSTDILVPVLKRLPAKDRLGFVTRCCFLGPEMPALHTRLFRFLADPRVWKVPLRNVGRLYRKAEELRRKCDETSVGSEQLVEHEPLGWAMRGEVPRKVLEEYAVLGCLSRGLRRRRMHVLVALLPRALISEWESWWSRADDLLRKARHSLSRRCPTPAEREAISDLASDLHKLYDKRPPEAAFTLADCCDPLAQAAPGLAKKFLVLLDRIPEFLAVHDQIQIPERSGYYSNKSPRWELASFAAELLPHTQLAQTLLDGSINLLESLDPAAKNPDWTQRAAWLGQPLLDELKELVDTTPQYRHCLPKMFDTLRILLRKPHVWDNNAGPCWYLGISLLARLLNTGATSERAAAFLQALSPSALAGQPWYDPKNLDVLVELAEGDSSRFECLKPALSDWDPGQLETLGQVAAEPERRSVLSGLLCSGEAARVRRFIGRCRPIGPQSSAALSATLEVEPQAILPEPERFPPDLREMASRLHALDVTAVERVLGQAFPTRLRLEREIKALEDRIVQQPNENMQRRLANLRARLDAPHHTPSSARLANLRAKLEHRLRLATLACWEAVIEETLSLQPELQSLWIDGLPEVSYGLATLSPPFRSLAIRLLKARAGPPPWDLRDDPCNASFLTRLAEHGADPAPWLNGLGGRDVTATDGTPLRLALEPDPLEVLQMGRHFRTCLAPDDINFFSCVAIAVDINKRVLYARDQQDRVVGRCLLALTDQGGLLTFHDYANRSSLGFDKLVAAFVAELAKQVGVVPVAKGRVSCLVAPDWYDDGPEDLTGSMEFLAEGSPFRKRLSHVAPDKLLDAVREALWPEESDPPPLYPMHIASLLELPEFENRPALSIPLADELPVEQLPLSSQVRLARLLRLAGETQRGRRVLNSLPVQWTWSTLWYGEKEILVQRLAKEFIDIGLPHRAFRLLRLYYEENDYESWADSNSEIALLVVDALIGLHRHAQAANICRTLLGGRHLEDSLRRQFLSRLEGGLDDR